MSEGMLTAEARPLGLIGVVLDVALEIVTCAAANCSEVKPLDVSEPPRLPRRLPHSAGSRGLALHPVNRKKVVPVTGRHRQLLESCLRWFESASMCLHVPALATVQSSCW